MEAGTRTLIKKHAMYLSFAAWHIVTHFHVIVPWLLVPVIFAFRMPIFEPSEFNFATVKVANIPHSFNCTEKGIRNLLIEVGQSYSTWDVNDIKGPLVDEHFANANDPISRYFKRHANNSDSFAAAHPRFCLRCNATGQGHMLFPSVADAEAFMKSQVISLHIDHRPTLPMFP
jgi:hypothetical protein